MEYESGQLIQKSETNYSWPIGHLRPIKITKRSPPPRETVSQLLAKEERQSGSKALECGSLKLWEIIACIKSNVFIHLARLNRGAKGYRSKSFPPDHLSPFSRGYSFHITTQPLTGED
jgi:hypothetical protein